MGMRASRPLGGERGHVRNAGAPRAPVPQLHSVTELPTLTFSVLSTSYHVGPDHLEAGGLGWLDWWAGWQA